MSRRSIILFAAICLIWGIPYFLIRIAVTEITPAVLVFARTAIGALILLPVVIVRGGLREIGRRWPFVLAFAVAEIGIPWLFLFRAEQQISSSLAGLLVSCVPLVGIGIAPLFGRRERLGPLGIVGLVLGLVGVAAIVGLDFHASNTGALLGMILVVIGYATGPAIINRFLGGISSIAVNGVALAACAVAYAPVAILQWPHAVPSVSVLVSVAVLAVVCTATAFLVFFALIREIGPVRATVSTYINPAVAAIAGVLILDEKLTVGMALGFVLVIGGSILATRRGRTA
ncbi:MAG TPA: DMT family transporter [Spirochaetia bacterium]